MMTDWPENWEEVADAVWEDDLDPWEELPAVEAALLREELDALWDDGPPAKV